MDGSLRRWLVFPLLWLASAEAWAGDLCVTLDHVKTGEGAVLVQLYDRAEAYQNDDRLEARTVEATADRLEVCFADLPPGRYGLTGFQDRNRNRRIDRDFLGLPLEAYGFSRDARPSLIGPPPFEALAVEVGTGTTRTVMTLRR